MRGNLRVAAIVLGRDNSQGSRVLQRRLIKFTDERMNTIGPGSGAIFGPHARLPRRQISGIKKGALDLRHRIVIVRRIEIVDEVAAYFRNRCSIRSHTELPVRQAFRDRQSPALAQTRKDCEQGGAISLAQLRIRQTGQDHDLAA
jgi:hypothetical protein